MLADADLLARLVGFDSTSSNSNVPIADFVCEYLERPGVAVFRHPGPEPGKVSVVALAGEPDEQGAGLLLCGHMDVVPADPAEWSGDPFVLAERDGSLVGRGACDMKASIALAMNLLASAEPARLRRPLGLLLTHDEEVGTLGAQHFAATWTDDPPLPTSVVVGEPTSLRVVRMHKGHLVLRVVVRGKAAHTGAPHLGANAIESAARVVAALGRLAGVMKQKRCDSSAHFTTVPFPVLAVSRIAGGTALNVVPDRCVIDVGVRLLPGMNTVDAIEWVRDTAVKSDPHGRVELAVVNDSPPMLLAADAEIHRVLCELTGQRASHGVSFASDAGPLAKAGYECVLFGPGSIDVAHRPGEFVPVDELRQARQILGGVVERLCLA